MRVGLRGVARWRDGVDVRRCVVRGVWRSGRAARSSRGGARRRRAAVRGPRGTVDIVACVWSCGAAEVLAGAPALRESGACGPFERDKCLRRFAGPAERPASGQGLSGVAPRRGELWEATAAQRNPPTTAPAEMSWRPPNESPQDTPAQPRGEPGAKKVFEEFQV